MHKLKGDFSNTNIDFEKRERLMKQAKMIDRYNKSSRRGQFDVSKS